MAGLAGAFDGRYGLPIATLAATYDGGDTWTELKEPPPVNSIVFRDRVEGFARGTDQAQPTVYSSRDGGVTWTAHLLPAHFAPIEGKPWLTIPHVYLIRGGGVMAGILDQAFASFDGGGTWRQLVPAPAVSYYEVAFEDAAHWWAMQQD